MPTLLHRNEATFPLTSAEVEQLWQVTTEYRLWADDAVGISCVSEDEIRHLNQHYRQRDQSTNVLTFTYDTSEHDIVLCMDVAVREADGRNTSMRDYVALLLVHAFLHATGMDHEESQAAAAATHKLERKILTQCGLAVAEL